MNADDIRELAIRRIVESRGCFNTCASCRGEAERVLYALGDLLVTEMEEMMEEDWGSGVRDSDGVLRPKVTITGYRYLTAWVEAK